MTRTAIMRALADSTGVPVKELVRRFQLYDAAVGGGPYFEQLLRTASDQGKTPAGVASQLRRSELGRWLWK